MSGLTIILISLLAVELLLMGMQLFRNQKQLAAQQEHLLKLASELNAVMNTAMGFGNRLLSSDKQINALKNQYLDLISFSGDGQNQKRTYKQANHLAQMGASIDELKQSCEISHGEAELLAHMNLSQSH